MADEQFIPAHVILFGTTLANWTATNPIIKQKELVIEVGATMKGKIGDGSTPYLSLPYAFGGGPAAGNLQDVLNLGNSAVQGGGNIGIILLSDTDNTSSFSGSDIKISDILGGFSQVGMSNNGGTPYFFIKSTSNANIGKIVASAFSAPWIWTLPNKSGTFAMLSDITGGGGTLQATLNLGNSADNVGPNTNVILLSDVAGGTNARLDGASVAVGGATGYTEMITDSFNLYGVAIKSLVSLKDNGGGGTGGEIWVLDATGGPGSTYYAKMKHNPATGITGHRDIIFPDEKFNGTDAENTIMLHRTKEDSSWNNGAGKSITVTIGTVQISGTDGTDGFSLNTLGLSVSDPSNNFAITSTGSTYTGGGFTIQTVYAIPPTAARTIIVQDEGGITTLRPYVNQTATDADFTIPDGRNAYIELPQITFLRNCTLPTPPLGTILYVSNLNTAGFSWQVLGGTIIDAAGAVYGTFANQLTTTIMFIGTGQWRLLNQI